MIQRTRRDFTEEFRFEAVQAFHYYRAKHYQSIRAANLIESTFGTRTKRSNESPSREGMVQVMLKLGQCAEKKWRRLRGND